MSALTREMVVEKVREIADRVAASEGLEIVEVQYLGNGRARLLRIFIDRPEGVSHADCELITKDVGAVLDAEELIEGDNYTLEVSSPGVERKLSKPRDFERFTGQKVKILLREPIENQRRWDGVLAGFADGTISLEAAPGKTLRFGLDQVEKANLKFEW